MIRRNQFLDFVDHFRTSRMLVIGPAVIEIDIHATVNRLAPDRAMPVFKVAGKTTHPGGAALVAATIANLGAEVSLLAPVGEGTAGQSLRGLLDTLHIHLHEGGNGSTHTPELFRYLSTGHGFTGRQLLQLHHNWVNGVFHDPGQHVQTILQQGEEEGRPYSAVCIVDGLPASLSADDIEQIVSSCERADVPCVYDAAGGDALCALSRMNTEGLTHLVVNEGESCIAAGGGPSDHIDRLRTLCRTVCPSILLTMGRNGAVTGQCMLRLRNHIQSSDLSSERVSRLKSISEETTSSMMMNESADDECMKARDSSGEPCEVTPITTPAHALCDRRGVGFVTSGVFALCVSKGVGASLEEAAFLACSAASAAAAVPGPKSVTIDDILHLAYHEIAMQVADGVEVFDRIAREQLPVIDRAARVLLEAYTSGKQVLVFGNGGSAAEANHLVTELTGQFRRKRAALPAISLSSNDALATCIANDYGFDDLFARQVEAFCREGDVVIAMSTSGRSVNVIRGLEEAKKRGARTIGFTGEREGLMKEWCDVLLAVPSVSTPRIQEAHLFVIHVMCEMLDQRVDREGKLHPSASEI